MTVDINKIKVGDPLIVKTGDIETFETYKSKGHFPGYAESMQKYNGTIGVIKKIDFRINFIRLSFVDKECWTYLPEWLSYFEDGIQEVRPYELPKSPEPEYKFKVGDIVFIEDVGGEGNEGYGKIVYINNKLVGVCHCTSNEAFHTCNKNCPNYYGWFYTPDQIRIP